MTFPILPLFWFLAGLSGANIGVSAVLSILLMFFGACIIVGNATSGNYDQKDARLGLWLILAAIVLSVVGVVYIGIAFIVIYLLAYWVVWRFVIKNIIAAFRK